MKLLFSLLLAILVTCEPAAGQADGRRTIVFLGDSITAGYGLEDHTRQAFPGVIQRKIDAAGLPYRVVNAGLSGDTTAGGLRRIDWVLRQRVDVFVLELGGNDGLRGLPVATAKTNLQAIIDRVRGRFPEAQIVVAGMLMPANMGGYAEEFAGMFPALAEANGAALIPFILDGVGGVPDLNMPDGIHPTAEGHARIAELVWGHLRPLLRP
jgi:acyl-CoA thioesterase I